jgi:hypothetical protein
VSRSNGVKRIGDRRHQFGDEARMWALGRFATGLAAVVLAAGTPVSAQADGCYREHGFGNHLGRLRRRMR